MKLSKTFLAAKFLGMTLAGLMLCLGMDAATAAANSGQGPAASASARAGLKPQRVKSIQQLRRLLKSKNPTASPRWLEVALADASTAGGDLSKSASDSGGNQHSTTNVQVEGVDEGDRIKTDGRYLYTLQGGQLRIIEGYPADTMNLLASVTFEEGFYPIELYLDGNRLAVIGNLWLPDTGNGTEPAPAAEDAPIISKIAVAAGENLTVAKVFNIADKRNPVQEREVSFSGHHVASRKIGDAVYLIGRTYPIFYTFAAFAVAAGDGAAKAAPMTRESMLPKMGDSAVAGGKLRPLPLSNVSYFPGFVDPNYVVVAGFRLTEPNRPADIRSYLGAGEVAYASLDNLYLSAADYRPDTANPVTHIYSFGIDQGRTRFLNAGEVPGTVLNQFSMDEYKDHFRIATTVWQTRGDKQWNNVYTLDDSMKIVGRAEHIAEGESIFAARFMGDRAYLVTFRQTDPLFALDLSDPTAPKVMGELILPGFSNYLHPLDDRHLIGIGQETRAEGETVEVIGMKLALFDVSDITQPKLMHDLVIGRQGTYSDALYDHKAVWFDRKRLLLGFPISETAEQAGQDWPATVFQGAHVYKVSLADGFERRAAITHLPAENPYAWNRYISRLFTIEDQLYTVSEGRVQANELGDFALTGALDVLELPKDEPVPVDPSVEPEPRPDGSVTDPDTVACTLDVQICPDGATWVGRVGPSCEFAPCPAAK